MSSLPFKALLLDISNELTSGQLDHLKFLCGTMVGKRELETINSGFKLFQCLSERGKLSQDKRELLSELLKQIHRKDLSEKLASFQSLPECADNQISETEKDKMDIATEVIVENVGRNWRKLGRKLYLSESKLDSISKRHPTDLEETARELLKEWTKIRGSEARTSDLIEALRACQHNLTADKVEERLASM
ncbi:protein FADD [Syngnathoides biaculeatus]|uniref:protein FADD n=1 Tax=Syngnathoides biaculeatus TaxID=300417 RepID=UPI002ADE1AE9|nr:protein FADD [Syngnathoides biaculeatus]